MHNNLTRKMKRPALATIALILCSQTASVCHAQSSAYSPSVSIVQIPDRGPAPSGDGVESKYVKRYSAWLVETSTKADIFQSSLSNLKNRFQLRAERTDSEVPSDLNARIMEQLPLLNSANKELTSPKLEARKVKRLDIRKTLNLALVQNLDIAIVAQQIPFTKWNYIGALGGFLPSATIGLNGAGCIFALFLAGSRLASLRTQTITTLLPHL